MCTPAFAPGESNRWIQARILRLLNEASAEQRTEMEKTIQVHYNEADDTRRRAESEIFWYFRR